MLSAAALSRTGQEWLNCVQKILLSLQLCCSAVKDARIFGSDIQVDHNLSEVEYELVRIDGEVAAHA
jgi:hypothetical protein